LRIGFDRGVLSQPSDFFNPILLHHVPGFLATGTVNCIAELPGFDFDIYDYRIVHYGLIKTLPSSNVNASIDNKVMSDKHDYNTVLIVGHVWTVGGFVITFCPGGIYHLLVGGMFTLGGIISIGIACYRIEEIRKKRE